MISLVAKKAVAMEFKDGILGNDYLHYAMEYQKTKKREKYMNGYYLMTDEQLEKLGSSKPK